MTPLEQHPWLAKAACAGLPGTMFFEDVFPVDEDGVEGPAVPEALERARTICAACPVRVQCHAVAMAEEAGAAQSRRFGVRAWLTPGQRYSVWRRDSTSCEQCGETYDPLGLVQGEAVCACGSFDEVAVPDGGDEWFPRHDGLLERLKTYLLENTEPGDRILPPYRMLVALGHRRKDDLPLCYARLIHEGLIIKGAGRGEYFRAAGKGALAAWLPPMHRHRARMAEGRAA